ALRRKRTAAAGARRMISSGNHAANETTRVRRIAEPAAWVIGLLLVWELVARLADIPAFVLPPPSVFLWRIVEEHDRLLEHGLLTTKLVLYGFVAGALPGIALGYAIAKSSVADRILYPIVVFIQGLPKVTLAPLLLVWFGFGTFPKVLLTALITIFPVLVDSIAGFKAIDRRQYYLSRSMGASWWQTFRFIELPTAMPQIFSGLKITIVIAVTVVIVVEWLNSRNGLGYLVLRATDSNDTPFIFAILVIGSTIGVILAYLVAVAERVVLPHSGRQRK
ncbi:MAG: ABC transporter permease, partial [Pseudomonadota bacterium]